MSSISIINSTLKLIGSVNSFFPLLLFRYYYYCYFLRKSFKMQQPIHFIIIIIIIAFIYVCIGSEIGIVLLLLHYYYCYFNVNIARFRSELKQQLSIKCLLFFLVPQSISKFFCDARTYIQSTTYKEHFSRAI